MTKRVARTNVPRPSRPALTGVLAAWLGRRSRLVRAALAGITAIAVTAAIAMLLYSIADTLEGIAVVRIAPFAFIALAILGLLLYWVGWRVFIGFDFEHESLQPGLAAVIWLLIGFITVLSEIVLAIVFLLQALSPT
ncbi:MAG TPA: hypothetical protein VMT34_01335 [Aggregatilineales bacterium]|nr:hypothetical protein [Aggregatilineales bacterium]